MNGSGLRVLMLVVLGAVIAALFWHFRDELMPATEETVSVPVEPPAKEPVAPAGPAYPLEPLQPKKSQHAEKVRAVLNDLRSRIA